MAAIPYGTLGQIRDSQTLPYNAVAQLIVMGAVPYPKIRAIRGY